MVQFGCLFAEAGAHHTVQLSTPSCSRNLLMLGKCHQKLKDTASAVRYLQMVTERDAKHSEDREVRPNLQRSSLNAPAQLRFNPFVGGLQKVQFVAGGLQTPPPLPGLEKCAT